MSRENVEVVRQAFEAWEARDLQAGRSLVHDDVEFHPGPSEPEAGPIRGVDALERYFRQWASAFDRLRAEPVELVDLGDWVAVPLHLSGRIPGSDAEVTHDETHIYRVRHGKIAEIRDFPSKEEALAFAGASEEKR